MTAYVSLPVGMLAPVGRCGMRLRGKPAQSEIPDASARRQKMQQTRDRILLNRARVSTSSLLCCCCWRNLPQDQRQGAGVIGGQISIEGPLPPGI